MAGASDPQSFDIIMINIGILRGTHGSHRKRVIIDSNISTDQSPCWKTEEEIYKPLICNSILQWHHTSPNLKVCTYNRTVLFRKHTILPVLLHTAVCQDVKKNTKIKDADLGPQNSPRWSRKPEQRQRNYDFLTHRPAWCQKRDSASSPSGVHVSISAQFPISLPVPAAPTSPSPSRGLGPGSAAPLTTPTPSKPTTHPSNAQRHTGRTASCHHCTSARGFLTCSKNSTSPPGLSSASTSARSVRCGAGSEHRVRMSTSVAITCVCVSSASPSLSVSPPPPDAA